MDHSERNQSLCPVREGVCCSARLVEMSPELQRRTAQVGTSWARGDDSRIVVQGPCGNPSSCLVDRIRSERPWLHRLVKTAGLRFTDVSPPLSPVERLDS